MRGIHPSLQHTESEEFSAANYLFGKEAVKRVKERAEELKTLRQVKTQFFRKSGAQVSGPSGCRYPYKGKGPQTSSPSTA